MAEEGGHLVAATEKTVEEKKKKPTCTESLLCCSWPHTIWKKGPVQYTGVE